MRPTGREPRAVMDRPAVTGPNGRLGGVLVAALAGRGRDPLRWSRPEYDLDDPTAAARLVARDRPSVVFHAAAWTDVDGCARDPARATRRNADAVGELARACADARAPLVLVSTNEVFDGERRDGRGYTERDEPRPINAYGGSKLVGEERARAAFSEAGVTELLWIVRTAWLYGPPGNDFPMKILAAAERLRPGEPLKVVTDEVGSPTYTRELAPAMVGLVQRAPGGIYHLAGEGSASRFELAQAVLAARGVSVEIMPIRRREFVRASVPPAWAVLDCGRAASLGVRLPPWQRSVSDYLGRE